MAPLYDVHAHIGVDTGFYLRGWWPYAATAQDMLGHLDANGMDRAVVCPFALPSAFDPYAFAEGNRVDLLPGRVPFDRENLLLATELDRLDLPMADGKRRLSMLAMIDPGRKVAEQLRNLEQLRPRIAGLKLQATLLEQPVRSLLREGRDLMEFAGQHGLPFLIHTSIDPADKWSAAADCLEVATAYPKVRFNLAHSIRFHSPTLRQAARMPNVWVDCAAHLVHCEAELSGHPLAAAPGERVDADYARPCQVLEAIHDILRGKYMWGSDNPFMSWCDETFRVIHSYREEAEVLHALPPAVRNSMGTAAPQAWLQGSSTSR